MGLEAEGISKKKDFSDFLADIMIPTDIKSIEAW